MRGARASIKLNRETKNFLCYVCNLRLIETGIYPPDLQQSTISLSIGHMFRTSSEFPRFNIRFEFLFLIRNLLLNKIRQPEIHRKLLISKAQHLTSDSAQAFIQALKLCNLTCSSPSHQPLSFFFRMDTI